MRWWPRTVRWQLILGLMLLEALSVGLFGLILVQEQEREVRQRAEERLAHQATSLALQAQTAFEQGDPKLVMPMLKMMGEGPSVAQAKITDPTGDVLMVDAGDAGDFPLLPAERAQLARMKDGGPAVIAFGKDRREGVKAIRVGDNLVGYAWVETQKTWDLEQLNLMLRGLASFAMIWIGASALLVLLMSRSISRPLGILQSGTRALMSSPEGARAFPLPVTVENEFGDLIGAFNRMVASIEDQRAGLHDTLSLLDSMLANAPIGLVFFDRRCRVVRVNEVFANMTGTPLSRHLGRTMPELLTKDVAEQLERAVVQVIDTEAPVHDLEVNGKAGERKIPWTWLVTAYPVRTTSNQVRWVGMILLDASERKRSEEALRRTEKLAATGRLAASIAHEINNPLEAVTNLLFLLRRFCQLDGQAENYVSMAEEELRRMSEITQQTLRFYRQSTLPTRGNVTELVDSVLTLYHSRLMTLGIELESDCDPDLDLFCYGGEVRQVIANLVSNAIDAMAPGGRLIVRTKRSRDWMFGGGPGVLLTVADTGAGMDAEVLHRLFEPFFTTKGATGTGLGLWLSQEIVVKHHGRVRVRSRVGSGGGPSGTVFQVFLPDNQELTRALEAQLQTEA